MNNLLSQFTKLRPYNMFVCLVEQMDTVPPVILKILYNLQVDYYFYEMYRLS